MKIKPICSFGRSGEWSWMTRWDDVAVPVWTPPVWELWDPVYPADQYPDRPLIETRTVINDVRFHLLGVRIVPLPPDTVRVDPNKVTPFTDRVWMEIHCRNLIITALNDAWEFGLIHEELPMEVEVEGTGAHYLIWDRDFHV